MAGERPMLDFFSVTGGIFDISIELTPPSLRATSPIFCVTKHRGGVLNVFDSETEIPHKATGHGNGGVSNI